MGMLVFWSLSNWALIMIIVMVAGASDRNVVNVKFAHGLNAEECPATSLKAFWLPRLPDCQSRFFS
jgi:hypothetical protein